MRYRVEVTVGDDESRVNLRGYAIVEAASPQDAKEEAEELVRESSIEALDAQEVPAL